MSIEPLSQDDLLRVVDRSYPAEYIDLVKDAQSGYEVFQGAAKVGERVSQAIANVYECLFILTAEGGIKAVGEVELFRATFANGAVTIPGGTIVRASKSGRDFRTLGDTTFGATDLGPHTVSIEAIAFGYEYNVPGQVIAANGEVLPGEIDTIWRIPNVAQVDPVMDPNMQVRQILPTAGGRAACLDGLGNDLNVPRLDQESDAQYKLRIRETPDTISPLALKRGINRIVQAIDPTATVEIREVGSADFPGFYFDAGSSLDSPQVPANNYAFDFDFTVRPEDKYKLILNFTEMRAFFFVVVPVLPGPTFGMAFDGSDADAFPLQNAFDTIAMSGPHASDSVFDGADLFIANLNKALWAMLDAKRAAGVGFDLITPDTNWIEL